MKTIGSKTTVASGNPRKAPAAPRKAPVAPSKTMAMATARKQVASKGSARKSAIVGSSARKSTAFKNTARKEVTPAQKSSHSARKSSVPTKSLSGKGAPKKTEKRPRAAKGKKRRRNATPDDSDLSDESGYSALEDVTDTSDDDDDEIELAEEEHLAGLGETPGSYVSTEDDDDDMDEEDVNLLDDDDDVAIVDSEDDDQEEDDDLDDDDDLGDENDKDIANFTVNTKYASIENDDDDDEDDDDDAEDDDDDDYDAELAQELAKDNASVDGDIDENSSWNGVSEDEHPADAHAITGGPDSAVRKVRFDVPSSDSESTDTDEEVFDEFFPDIFVSQNNLDPTFKKELENDSDGSCSSESYWDFDSAPNEFPAAEIANPDVDLELDLDDVGIAFEMPVEIPGDMALPSGTGDGHMALSGFPTDFETSPEDGYESDGDTTEDDDEPMPIVRRKVHPQVHEAGTDSETERPAKARRGHPRAASFDLDRSDEKPIVVANPHSRKMMIFTPNNRPRTMEVSPEQFDMGDFNFFTSVTDTLPGAGSGLGNDFGIFTGPGLFGSVGTGNPFDTLLDPLFEAQEEELDSDALGEEDEGEKVLNIDDFIQLDESDVEEDMILSMTGFGESAPSRPSTSGGDQQHITTMTTTTTTDNNSLLNHLTPQTVGSFRRNQIDKQLLFSSQASQDSLSFSGPYHSMALKGIKTGRVETAGVVPLTPMRRRKPSQDFGGNAKDALSLGLGMGLSSKRKATSDLAAVVAAANGSGSGSGNSNGTAVALSQKRQRSMSDIAPAGINV